MTSVILLEELAGRIESVTADLILPVRGKRGERLTRKLEIYKMQLPSKESATKQVPYIVLQVISGKDEQPAGQIQKNTCVVRFIFATYDENASDGQMALLNLISRIRMNLLEKPVLCKMFEVLKPMEYIIYPEDTQPYYLGEMITTWTIPEVERILD